MPRKSKGPRLWLHNKEKVWVIRDGKTFKRTGCGESETERAEQKLADYIGSKWEPDTSQHRPSDTDCANVIMIYLEHKLPNANRPRELSQLCGRLNDFWGGKKVNEIKGASCRAFTRQSTTPSMARRDLEILRAAVKHYHREYGLDYTPEFTLPEKGKPRTGHLTRPMAAKLLWAARKAGYTHLVRFILIGLYTGTRSGAISDMQWFPNTTGGYFDLDAGVMYRAPNGERETKKRKPPSVIPDRLLAHLRRWYIMDKSGNAVIRHVVHWHGKRVARVKRTFKQSVENASLPDWIIPHMLRHTAITWSMQAGKEINVVSSFYGVTVEELQRTYWHHHPEFQRDMRKAR